MKTYQLEFAIMANGAMQIRGVTSAQAETFDAACDETIRQLDEQGRIPRDGRAVAVEIELRRVMIDATPRVVVARGN